MGFFSKIFKPKLKSHVIQISVKEEEGPFLDQFVRGPMVNSEYSISTSNSCFGVVARSLKKDNIDYSDLSIEDKPTEVNECVLRFGKIVSLIKQSSDCFLTDLKYLHYGISQAVVALETGQEVPSYGPSDFGGEFPTILDKILSLKKKVDDECKSSTSWYNNTKIAKIVIVTLGVAGTGALAGFQVSSQMDANWKRVAGFMSVIPYSVFSFANSVCNSHLKCYSKDIEVLSEMYTDLKMITLRLKQIGRLKVNAMRLKMYLQDLGKTEIRSNREATNALQYLHVTLSPLNEWMEWFVNLKKQVDKLDDDILKLL